MSKRKTDNFEVNMLVFKDKRMPKGWVHLGDNSLDTVKKSYAERYRESKAWYKLFTAAKKYNIKLSGELIKKRQEKKKNDEENSSRAEDLIEKKYKKDKTQIKIPKAQVI